MDLWNNRTAKCHPVCFNLKKLSYIYLSFCKIHRVCVEVGVAAVERSVQVEGAYKWLRSLQSYFKPNQYGGQLSAKENRGRNRANQAVLSNPVIP